MQVVRNVAETAAFLLKDKPNSLKHMINFDPFAEQVLGGTVYQAFLSVTTELPSLEQSFKWYGQETLCGEFYPLG